jgi:Ca2+-binding RTX toxin-like protein
MIEVHFKNSTSTAIATSPDRDYFVDDGVTINTASGPGLDAGGTATGRTFAVAGDISAAAAAGIIVGDYDSNTGAADMTIASTGSVSGTYGLVLYGEGQTLANDGMITGTEFAGVQVSGDNAAITNTGTISGHDYGISVAGENATIVNRGSIYTTSFGAAIKLTADSATIVNRGNIVDSHGLNFAAAKDGVTVRNYGTIEGNILFGDGNDHYYNHGGSITGTVRGGAGNDAYYMDTKTNVKVEEDFNNGYDEVHTALNWKLGDNFDALYLTGDKDRNGTGNAENNYLGGNRGNNRLFGLDGADAFFGGRGTDHLTGGAGADGFYFREHAGKEIVTDFQDGKDGLVLIISEAITGKDFVKTHGHNDGDDLAISYHGTTMILEGVHKSQIDNADFFV